LVLWPTITLAEILSVGGLDLGLVLVNSCLVLLLTVGSVLVSEIEEETNDGYRMFEGLPVRRAEIVGAKFSGAFLLTIAFATSHMVLVAVWGTDPEQMHHIRTAIFSTGALSLVAIGVLYVGVLVLGLARTAATLGASVWVVSTGFIVAVTFLGWNVDSSVGGLVEIVGRADHAVILGVGLLFYGLAWLTAAHSSSFAFGDALRWRRSVGARLRVGPHLHDSAGE
jgi:hypothetical protein